MIRSHGGWAAVKQMRRAKMFEKTDARIPGDGDFVEQMLLAAEEQLEKHYRLQAKGYDLEKLASMVCDIMHVEPAELWAPGKERKQVAVRDLGIGMNRIASRLNLSLAGVSQSVKRGETIVQQKGYNLIDP